MPETLHPEEINALLSALKEGRIQTAASSPGKQAVSTYDLYTAPSLESGATWTKVTQTPVLTSGRWQVTLPANGSRAFFRLAAP